MKSKVVIIGATGFVGSHIDEVFEKSTDYEVSKLSAPRLTITSESTRALLAEAIKQQDKHPEFVEELAQADIIINAAGLPDPEGSNIDQQLGANALLPAVIGKSMDKKAKLIHISSVYVAGNAKKLTEKTPRNPFSDYARTKALGEEVLENLRQQKDLNICCVRATPLHEASKPGTKAFVNFANSSFASVAGKGNAPCSIASVNSFALFIKEVADYQGELPFIVMQPWEGLTVNEAMKIASGKDPKHIPAPVAKTLVGTGYKLSPLLKNKLIAPVHKVSQIWQGQEMETPWADKNLKPVESHIREELEGAKNNKSDEDAKSGKENKATKGDKPKTNKSSQKLDKASPQEAEPVKKKYDPVKRGLDIAIAGSALVATAPIQAYVAYKIKQDTGGKAIFTQDRPGKDGEVFKIYKFKTMKDLDPAKKEWAEKNRLESDAERLTPFGEKLRATSLDELPNLWNVLKGDMSIIGPRPLLVSFLPRYNEEQARRHEVRPGITGLAQTEGRNSISWQDKFKHDVEYVDNRSPLLDLKILGKTIKSVFEKDGIEYDHGDFLGNDVEEQKLEKQEKHGKKDKE